MHCFLSSPPSPSGSSAASSLSSQSSFHFRFSSYSMVVTGIYVPWGFPSATLTALALLLADKSPHPDERPPAASTGTAAAAAAGVSVHQTNNGPLTTINNSQCNHYSPFASHSQLSIFSAVLLLVATVSNTCFPSLTQLVVSVKVKVAPYYMIAVHPPMANTINHSQCHIRFSSRLIKVAPRCCGKTTLNINHMHTAINMECFLLSICRLFWVSFCSS